MRTAAAADDERRSGSQDHRGGNAGDQARPHHVSLTEPLAQPSTPDGQGVPTQPLTLTRRPTSTHAVTSPAGPGGGSTDSAAGAYCSTVPATSLQPSIETCTPSTLPQASARAGAGTATARVDAANASAATAAAERFNRSRRAGFSLVQPVLPQVIFIPFADTVPSRIAHSHCALSQPSNPSCDGLIRRRKLRSTDRGRSGPLERPRFVAAVRDAGDNGNARPPAGCLVAANLWSSRWSTPPTASESS